MGEGPRGDLRAQVIWGLLIAAGAGLVIAAVIQVLAPSVAKVPGLLLCGGDELTLVPRRRTSYGLCAGDPQRLGYGKILGVSILVWTAVCWPLGIALARWLARRPRRAR
jgi:hypothetical protein